jgi:hypothetical protein
MPDLAVSVPETNLSRQALADLLGAQVAAHENVLVELVRVSTNRAARLDVLAREHDIPVSTLRALIAQGDGPPTFTIGRLIFCRRMDWNAWLDGLAERRGVRLTERAEGRLAPA